FSDRVFDVVQVDEPLPWIGLGGGDYESIDLRHQVSSIGYPATPPGRAIVVPGPHPSIVLLFASNLGQPLQATIAPLPAAAPFAAPVQLFAGSSSDVYAPATVSTSGDEVLFFDTEAGEDYLLPVLVGASAGNPVLQ